MFGFGFGEAFLIGLMFIVGMSVLFSYDFLRKGVQKGRDQELDNRILDELDLLRVRVDAITDRLDSLDPSSSTDKTLPPSDVGKEPME